MKIAIYYDSLVSKGGAQRLVIELANRLHADIITSGFNQEMNTWLPIQTKVIDIGNITYKYSAPLSYFFETPLRFLFYKNNEYDVNIFVGTSAIFSAQKGKNNIWYCFSPNRLLYDLRDWKLKNTSMAGNLFFGLHIVLFRKLDHYFVKNRIKKIVALSNHVQERIKKFYDRDANTIYYGLVANQFSFKSLGKYYLAVSRLTIEKRMDVIASAFKKMPDKKLLLVGDGPLRKSIEQLVKNCKNITLLSNVSEQKLVELYQDCLAVVYLPKDEDFGLVPLEANASGKFCIGVDEGGCRETIINGKTGYLIKPTQDDLINRVQTIDRKFLIKQKNVCINHARKFDDSINIKKWKAMITMKTNK